jgi:hypothetical protein
MASGRRDQDAHELGQRQGRLVLALQHDVGGLVEGRARSSRPRRRSAAIQAAASPGNFRCAGASVNRQLAENGRPRSASRRGGNASRKELRGFISQRSDSSST